MANPEETDYRELLAKNLSQNLQASTQVFHLRGAIDYQKLSKVYRVMMAMMKKMTIDSKASGELSSEDQLFLSTYGKKADFIQREQTASLIAHVKELLDKSPEQK